ncbi:MAG: transketolase C-terminal domain-containing protein, partial [Acidimicrobiia bacterium]
VLAPSSPDAAGAAVETALDDPDPVVVSVDRSLLYSRAPLPGDPSASPWRGRIVEAGDDITVAATGRLVHLARQAAAESDASVEIVDIQRIAPLDSDTVLESVRRTSRLLVLHDEAAGGGVSSALAAAVADEGFWVLDAPVRRLTSPATPIPAAATLEDAYMLDVGEVRLAIKELVET